jgi:hypothetical protein
MRTICLFVVGAALACAHAPPTPASRIPPGQAEVRGFLYSDEGGLQVSTVAARGDQAIAPAVNVQAEALADRVVVQPPAQPELKPPGPGQPSGHQHLGVDIISSASVTANNEVTGTEKWRFQGIAGATVNGNLRGGPASASAQLRASSEPDYGSLSAKVSGSADLLQRNVTVSGFAGYGHDVSRPPAPPPGQEGLWPAGQDRVSAGGTVAQVLSRTLLLTGGVGFAHQWGTLSSPHRRATVVTTLFPEVVPALRERLTAFSALSWYIGGGTALHSRLGGYVDSWGVRSLIPEVALAKEVGEHGLFTLRYRLYAQGAADFYSPTYQTLEPLLSGDPRLGAIEEHLGSFDARWWIVGRPGWSNALILTAGYEFSVLGYPMLGSVVRAELFSVGLVWDH